MSDRFSYLAEMSSNSSLKTAENGRDVGVGAAVGDVERHLTLLADDRQQYPVVEPAQLRAAASPDRRLFHQDRLASQHRVPQGVADWPG